MKFHDNNQNNTQYVRMLYIEYLSSLQGDIIHCQKETFQNILY